MTALTLLGRGPSWRECSFSTPDIWGAATCLITPGLEKRDFTKVFAFDNDASVREATAEAKRRGIPVVGYGHMGYATEPWPTREIVAEFKTSYFLNSISRMIAYALYLKYTKLFIYGIDQGPTWALQQAKPYVTFWIGYAIARGIDVRLGKGSLSWTYGNGPDPLEEPVQEPEAMRIASAVGVA